jgi:hypothetical protein
MPLFPSPLMAAFLKRVLALLSSSYLLSLLSVLDPFPLPWVSFLSTAVVLGFRPFPALPPRVSPVAILLRSRLVVKRSKAKTLAELEAEIQLERRKQKCISKKGNNNKTLVVLANQVTLFSQKKKSAEMYFEKGNNNQMLADQVVHAKQATFFSHKQNETKRIYSVMIKRFSLLSTRPTDRLPNSSPERVPDLRAIMHRSHSPLFRLCPSCSELFHPR